ncbi:MAG: aminoglycoside phosphotransferase family protein [Lautropia sp.]|nr:aminoglycoside phosphotransferase family protein [Lautropia sp.]
MPVDVGHDAPAFSHDRDAAEQDLVRRDPGLPGLPLLLDDTALTTRLRLLAPEAGIASVKAGYLRYKPGRSCLARIMVRQENGRKIPGYVHLFSANSPDWDWQRRRIDKRFRAGTGLSAHADETTWLQVAHIEHDRRISAMHALLREAEGAGSGWRMPVVPSAGHAHLMPLRLSPALSALGADAGWPEETVLPCLPLRYKPERRFIGQLLRPDSSAAVLIRACTPDDFAATERGAMIAAALGGQSLLCSDSTHHLIASRWLEGYSLDPAGAGGWPDAPVLSQVAATVRRLHQAEAPMPLPAYRPQDHTQAIARAADACGLLCPALQAEVQALRGQLDAALCQDEAEAGARATLTHGDLSLEQIIRSPDGELHLIDWDNAAHGDPLGDLGSLLARLIMQSLDLPAAQRPAPLELVDAFSTDYDAGLSARERRSIGIYTAGHLLRLMPEGFRIRRADWPARMQALLKTAQDITQRLTSSR